MLVRLLDAFVWRNHGGCHPLANSLHLSPPPHADRQETQQLGFTYVQGMNVLAAPFLYTMPSELEAFFCFAKFIEESCPLYVQPTLEGVHRGLKVRSIRCRTDPARDATSDSLLAARPMSQDRRPGAVHSPAVQEPLCGDIRVSLCVLFPLFC